MSTDDDFWYPGRPILDGTTGNKGGWVKGYGISNNMGDGVNGLYGVLCEIRTNS